jgi:hypothetical protein
MQLSLLHCALACWEAVRGRATAAPAASCMPYSTGSRRKVTPTYTGGSGVVQGIMHYVTLLLLQRSLSSPQHM